MNSVKPSFSDADLHEFSSIPTFLQMTIPTETQSPAVSYPRIEQDLWNDNIFKGSSYFDMITTDVGEDELDLFSENPLKRKKSGSEKETAKRRKSSELGDKNDGALVILDPGNPEGKSEAELKMLMEYGLKAVESLLAMKSKQLQDQRELVSQEILKREEMERRLEQLQAERDYIYSRGYKDVCHKLLTSGEFGMRMCNAVHAGVECVLSQNSEASHDALSKMLDLVQSSNYNLFDVIHPGMSFDTLKAWSLEFSPSGAPIFQD